VAGGDCQCHVDAEYDLCGLFNVIRRSRALRWRSVGLSRRSMLCLLWRANIGNSGAFRWILLCFYNLSNSAACITMSFSPTADVNDAVRCHLAA